MKLPDGPMAASTQRAFTGFLALALMTLIVAPARAFDAAGFKSRVEATVAELKTKSLADSSRTLTRLSELIAIGSAGAGEYGVAHPQYGALMNHLAAVAPQLNTRTGNQLEDEWGETGSEGDAFGIPLKSLSQWNEQRNAIELVVAPAMAYIFVQKWTSAGKTHWLDDARDELIELQQHLALTR